MKIAAVLALGLLLIAPLEAQRGNQPPPPAPRAGAPIDLTGYWVSIVTADWRWRMVTPAKGDYQGVQLNPEGRKVADTWDPAKDEAAGEQCRSYGAPALMSVPGRIHITWQDDTTLKIDTDAGTQTRLLRFGAAQGRGATGSGQAPTPNEPRTWQGVSQARWLSPRPGVPLQWKADRTFLVPGHGHVYDKLDLLEYRDAVTIVRDRVQDLVDEGKTLAQVKAANPTLGYRSQYGADSGPWTTDMFVEVIYNELAAKKVKK